MGKLGKIDTKGSRFQVGRAGRRGRPGVKPGIRQHITVLKKMRREDAQMENTQRENTERENTQRENTQMENTQIEDA